MKWLLIVTEPLKQHSSKISRYYTDDLREIERYSITQKVI